MGVLCPSVCTLRHARTQLPRYSAGSSRGISDTSINSATFAPAVVSDEYSTACVHKQRDELMGIKRGKKIPLSLSPSRVLFLFSLFFFCISRFRLRGIVELRLANGEL